VPPPRFDSERRVPVAGVITLVGVLGFVALLQVQAHRNAEHKASDARAAALTLRSQQADLAGLAAPSGFARVAHADGCQAAPSDVCLASSLSNAEAAHVVEVMLGATASSVTLHHGLPGAEPEVYFTGFVGKTPVVVLVESHRVAERTATSPAVYRGSTVDIALPAG
jgi:hypothetical protein